MQSHGQILKGISIGLLLLLVGCNDQELQASDTSIERMFRHSQPQLAKLIEMANQDRVEVLWLTTHESEPSDTVLPEDRWLAYDRAVASTGVRSVHRTDRGFELGLAFTSDDFMRKGVVKGIVYSPQSLAPLLPSLDDGAQDAVASGKMRVAYKTLASSWYIFVRQE